MLDVAGVEFTYGGAPLLRNLALRVDDGESAFVLGPSGSGKTTLLRIIAGLEQAPGTITLAGTDVAGLAPHLRRIGMMSQEPALFPHLTVAGNVAFGLRYRGVPSQGEEAEVARYLELVGLADRADSAVDQLSGGQRQRVALARTLAARPRAVLLDEPLTALDAELRLDLGQRIKSLLHEEGVPALWVSHDPAEARRLGDAVYRLEGGRLVKRENGPAAPANLE